MHCFPVPLLVPIRLLVARRSSCYITAGSHGSPMDINPPWHWMCPPGCYCCNACLLSAGGETDSNMSKIVWGDRGKIVDGRIQKFLSEQALMDQPFIKDPTKTVATVIKEAVATVGEKISLRRFERCATGCPRGMPARICGQSIRSLVLESLYHALGTCWACASGPVIVPRLSTSTRVSPLMQDNRFNRSVRIKGLA